jgi:hypothetical protein
VARITTPFGSRSTAAEVAEGIDLSGKRATGNRDSGHLLANRRAVRYLPEMSRAQVYVETR